MNTDDLPILDLTGTPRQRGRIHGEALRREIAAMLDDWQRRFAAELKCPVEDAVGRFLATTDFSTAIARWAPDIGEEVDGIAEGADQDPTAVLAYQCLDETWWHALYSGAIVEPVGDALSEACSSLAVEGVGATAYVAQNMDIGKWVDGHQVLLRVRGDDDDSYVYTFAGFLGLNGLNRRGVGICCNTLMQLDHAADGLPVAFVVRKVLQQKSLADALRFLRQIRHASGQNYVIGARDGFGSFECAVDSVDEWRPQERIDRLVCHTNHPLASRCDSMHRGLQAKRGRDPLSPGSTTHGRYDAMRRFLSDSDGRVGIDAIKALLSSKSDPKAPISRAGLAASGNPIGFTAGSMVYELTEPPVLHLAAGPPCGTAYRRFEF